MTEHRSLEALIFHMPTVAERASSDWERGFARSIVRQARRPKWRPSLKQENLMRRLVSELFSEPDDIQLFEEVDA